MIDWVIIMKKTKSFIAAVMLITAAAACIFNADAVKAGTVCVIERCLTTVIPSLYAMMAVSGLLLHSGTVSAAGKFLHKAGRLFFGMDGDIFAVFLFSSIAGYPVGAKMLLSLYRSGRISRRDAELLTGICFGAGPAFVFGCAAGLFYSPASAGLLLILSCTASNIILAFAVSFFLRKHGNGRPHTAGVRLRADMLADCVSAAGRSMGEICFAVAAFAVISSLLECFGIIPAAAELLSSATGRDLSSAKGIIGSVIDVTAVSSLPCGNMTLLPPAAGLVSFGGLCVFMQLSAIYRGELSLAPAFLLRICASALSFGICRVLLPHFFVGKTVCAAAMRSQLHRGASPVPSVLLILMTVMLFAEYSRVKKSHRS